MWKDGQTDRQADMTKLTVAFREFTNAPIKRYALGYDLKRKLYSYIGLTTDLKKFARMNSLSSIFHSTEF
jgi:hypothetical protein